MEPRIFSCLDLVKTKGRHTDEVVDMYYLDIDKLAHELSIPDGYFVEILLTSISNEEFGEKVVFPNETKKYIAMGLEKLIDEKMNVLSRIGGISQSHSFLAGLGLGDIAKELSLGYSRFEIGDYDGAIKSYRKVVEGFRNHLEEKETREGKKVFKRLLDNSENRTEKIADFLNKTYSLLSNFGEHYGTHAFEEEGVFSHKLVENLTEYLTKKLRSK
jgi:tetratricopeptide (TPR) repeat protein